MMSAWTNSNRGSLRRWRMFLQPAGQQVVQADDAGALGQHRLAEMRPDEAGATRDQHRSLRIAPHGTAPCSTVAACSAASRRYVSSSHARCVAVCCRRVRRRPARAISCRSGSATANARCTAALSSAVRTSRPGSNSVCNPGHEFGDDRCAAGGRLEQAHAGAVAGAPHVGASQVQCPIQAGIEAGMPVGRQVLDAVHVVGPGDVAGVHRAGHDKAQMR